MYSSWLLPLLPLATALYQNGSVVAPCDSPLYCQGEILREIELARPFEDSKLYVDLPTKRPIDEVIAAFHKLSKPLSNNTELNDFLTENFGAAGSELAPVPAEDLTTDPTFLDHVNSTTVRDFISQVIGIWPDLTRQYVGAGNCTGCVSSFIPVNRTFVVAGGRFREPYYWDSFWIVEGLLRTQGSFTKIALNIIENFLDIIDEIGFMPNGARQYYMNRSQPPLLAQMIRVYVEYTNDTSIIERALPTLEKEHQFFMNNRTVDVEVDGEQYTLNHYQVSNTQPRPESYYEDYVTANNESYYAAGGIIYPATSLVCPSSSPSNLFTRGYSSRPIFLPPPGNESERATLYSDLASGAESGWDYSSRWLKTPGDAVNDVYFPLRSLNTKEIIPVDLNSILYHNEIVISGFHNQTGNSSAADAWAEIASKRSEAMTAVMWDEEHFRYFDYNLTSSARNVYILADEDSTEDERAGAPDGQMLSFNVAQFYPFWTGAAPAYLKNNPASVQRAYAPVADQMLRKAGTIPATNLQTGKQWDEPNAWPPHQYIVTAGLLNTPATFGEDDPAYIWTQDLAFNLSQRYVDSSFCTWRVTGGDTADLPQLEGADPAANGTMFEKYADNSTNAAGGGGEYEVVEGFGWSNGVLIWLGDIFGEKLQTPECGDITAAQVSPDKKRKRSAVEMGKYDSKFVKRWKK